MDQGRTDRARQVPAGACWSVWKVAKWMEVEVDVHMQIRGPSTQEAAAAAAQSLLEIGERKWAAWLLQRNRSRRQNAAEHTRFLIRARRLK